MNNLVLVIDVLDEGKKIKVVVHRENDFVFSSLYRTDIDKVKINVEHI